MTDLPTECCARCRFARIDQEIAEDIATGAIAIDELGTRACHRHAPPIITVRDRHRNEDAATEWEWPGVMVEDWCGDFEPKATDAT